MDYMEIAEKAMKKYPLAVETMDFIAQSGSTIYKVKDIYGIVYCLRLYASVNNALGTEWTNKKAINSMLQWMSALSKDTDMILPSPYTNSENELITDIDGVLCSLENWLDGEQNRIL
jgi:hypothetical protein